MTYLECLKAVVIGNQRSGDFEVRRVLWRIGTNFCSTSWTTVWLPGMVRALHYTCSVLNR